MPRYLAITTFSTPERPPECTDHMHPRRTASGQLGLEHACPQHPCSPQPVGFQANPTQCFCTPLPSWLAVVNNKREGGSQASRKYHTTKLGTHFPSPSSHQHNISINHRSFPSPYPSPPPFSTLQPQSKPVPGLERSIIEFLVSSCCVLLSALPVSNKFQSVNSPLTLAHPSIYPTDTSTELLPPPTTHPYLCRPGSAPLYSTVFLIHLPDSPRLSVATRAHVQEGVTPKRKLSSRFFFRVNNDSSCRTCGSTNPDCASDPLLIAFFVGCYTIFCDYILLSTSSFQRTHSFPALPQRGFPRPTTPACCPSPVWSTTFPRAILNRHPKIACRHSRVFKKPTTKQKHVVVSDRAPLRLGVIEF